MLTTRMKEVTAIQFTQDQMRTLTGVSAETMRHWRKTIPYLSSKTGKAARFSFTDLVALAVTSELVNSFGIQIAKMNAGVNSLFVLLGSQGVGSINGMVAFITPTEVTLSDVDSFDPSPSRTPKTPTIAIPLAPHAKKIQQQVLPIVIPAQQTELPFALQAVRSKP